MSRSRMESLALLSAAIIGIIVVCGCVTVEPGEQTAGTGPVTLDESRAIALDYVTSMEEYTRYQGRNLTLVETITLRCPSCWEFVCTFDMQSMKDPVITDRATVRVTVAEGRVTDVFASYGSREQ